MPASPPPLHLGYSCSPESASRAQLRPRAQVGPGKGASGTSPPRTQVGAVPPGGPDTPPHAQALVPRRARAGLRRGASSRHSLQTICTFSAACSIGAVSPPLSVTPGGSARRELHTANRQGMEESRGPGLGERGREAPPQLQPSRLTLPPGQGAGRSRGRGGPGRVPSLLTSRRLLFLTFSRRLRAGSCGGAA